MSSAVELSELADTFLEYLEDQDLSDKEKEIEKFHFWMRRHTDLGSGTIVDYRKYIAQFLDEDGNIDTPENIKSSHKRAGVSKYREFSTTSGDSNE